MRRWSAVIAALVVITTVVVLALTWAVRPGSAQSDDWAAYLVSPSGSQWARVDVNGIQPFELAASPSAVAIDPTGSRLVECAVSSEFNAALSLVEPDAQAEAVTIDLGPAVGCQLGRDAFGPGGERLWVGLAGDPALGHIAWKLLEVDLADGTIVRTLDANSKAARGVAAAGGPMMPYVYASDGQQVVFGIAPYGIGGAASIPAFRWDGVDQVVPLDGWGNYGADGLLASDEVVWPAIDESLPGGTSEGMLPAYNVVMLRGADGEAFPIFHTPDWLIDHVEWVNGGQQVVIPMRAGAEEPVTRWVVLNREGALRDFNTGGAEVVGVMDSRDGFAAMTKTATNDGGSEYAVMRYVGNSAMVVATFEDAGVWALAWVTPSAPENDLPAFAPLGGTAPTATPSAILSATTVPPTDAGIAGGSPTPRASMTPTPTAPRETLSTRQSTVQVSATPGATDTRAPTITLAVTSTDAPRAEASATPTMSRTPAPTRTAEPTITRFVPPTNTVTTGPSATFTPAPTRPANVTNTPAPSGGVTATPRRGIVASRTPTSGATARPTQTRTTAPTLTRTPAPSATRTLTLTPTRTPTRTLTPTTVRFPSKTPLPTTSGLPTKAPISGPTSTLATGGGGGIVLRITNFAGTDLCEVYFGPSSEPTWGENQLENGAVLADNAYLEWQVPPDLYDVRVYDCFGNYLEDYGFDLTGGSLDVQVTATQMTAVPLP